MNNDAFLSPHNPLGWTPADAVAFAFCLALVFLLRRGHLQTPQALTYIAARPILCAVILFALPILLRLALLARNPVPVPSGADDFGYLLVADTLRHLRLANPPQAHPDFFEQLFVLQRPAYAAMFPLGSGLLLAIAWVCFGTPWAGVLLGAGLFAAACYWMLRGWLSPNWAVIGGLLAAIQFGPLCYWMNCYWGGYVSAIAGCLAFGALPRRNHALLGLGLALQVLTRQYELLLLIVAIAVLRPHRPRWLTLACFAPALLLIAAQNSAVTGHSTTLPYAAYRYQYGVPATFAFQPDPLPHRELNTEQELDYRAETAVHDATPPFIERLALRIRFLRFFLMPALLIAFVAGLRLRLACALAVFALGSNLYPYFYPHYIAAASCLFLLAVLRGLQRVGRGPAVAIVGVSIAQFVFGLLRPQGGWDWLNGPDPQGRATVNARLTEQPGNQLVFVHYSPVHGLAEWIHNSADLTGARIVWVHDLGTDRDGQAMQDLPGRTPWLLFPDETPPRLVPFPRQTSPFEQVQ